MIALPRSTTARTTTSSSPQAQKSSSPESISRFVGAAGRRNRVAAMPPLKPGDKAPDFSLLDQNGETVKLSKLIKERKAKTLVYFYPKADTPGCTTQACGLRDAMPKLGDVTVLGISPDAPAKQ